MIIVGCDYHPGFQEIAFVDCETGECWERRLEHREEALNYAMQFAREMDSELADKFVGMYVNKWTLGYGEKGKKAVRELIERGTVAGLLPGPPEIEFLTE